MELIDREKLKQQVDPNTLMFNSGMSKDYKRGFTDGLIRCYELITRQPTVNTWIKCSEDNMPQYDEVVLIIYKKMDVFGNEYKTVSTVRYDGKMEFTTLLTSERIINAIAWMPIPEYKENE